MNTSKFSIEFCNNEMEVDVMEITSIEPAIKVVKENTFAGCDMYIASGDKIRITDTEGKVYVGEFLFMELGKYEEEDDTIILRDGNSYIEVQCSWIKEIEEL